MRGRETGGVFVNSNVLFINNTDFIGYILTYVQNQYLHVGYDINLRGLLESRVLQGVMWTEFVVGFCPNKTIA